MKLWISAFGVLALLSTVALAMNYGVAHRHARVALRDELKFDNEARSWAAVAATERQRDESLLQTDRITDANADIELRNANLAGGHGKARAEFDKAKARARVQADEKRLALDAEIAANGLQDDRVERAQVRARACARSLMQYQQRMDRDKRLAYPVAVLWLVFGATIILAMRR